MGSPQLGRQMQERLVKRFSNLDRSRSHQLRRLTVENLCPSATVVRVHSGALAEERGFIKNVGGSRSLLITVTVQLISTTFVVVEICFYHTHC